MDTVNLVVGAIVVRGDSVLLLQRGEGERFLPGRWGIPAGKVHYGETLQEAVLRELEEEAGLAGRVTRMAGSTWFSSMNQGRCIQNFQQNFVVLADSADVRLDSSSQDHRWVSVRDLKDPPVPMDAFTREVLSQALVSTGDTALV